MKTCPACGRQFDGHYPATSRLDNKTFICPHCGDVEARFFPRGSYRKDELFRIIWSLMHQVPPEKRKSPYRSINDDWCPTQDAGSPGNIKE